MGSTGSPRARLAEALFSSVQRRVLALLFLDPERSFRGSEVIRLVRGGTGGVHRELRRLADAGWLSVTEVGNQKHYRANRACAAFTELRGLVAKTMAGRAMRAPVPPREPERAHPPKRALRTRPPVEEAAGASDSPAASEPDEGWKSW